MKDERENAKRPGSDNAGALQDHRKENLTAPENTRKPPARKGALLEAALAYAALGMPVFPCKNKKPMVEYGFHAATVIEETIIEWWTKWPNAQIGIPTGNVSTFDVIDLDVNPKKNKNGKASIPDWEERSPVIVNTPSGGVHLYFLCDGYVYDSVEKIAPGVDTRGRGGYAIIPPSPGYTWHKGGINDLLDLPPWPDDLMLPDRDLNAKPNDDLHGHPMRVGFALAVIPNQSRDRSDEDASWKEWSEVGMAVWAATDGDDAGFAEWDEWSAKSNKYNSAYTHKRWREFHRSPPTKIGMGSIVHWANEINPSWEADALEQQMERINREARRIELPRSSNSEPSLTLVPPKEGTEKPAPRSSKSKALVTFRHGDVAPEPMKWLIRHRLPEVGAGLLAGQWGMYKTFMLLDISVHVMLGWNWTGERVHRQGGVLLLAPEGAASIPLRMAALVEHKIEKRGGRLPFDPNKLPFIWTSECPPLISKTDPMPTLAATAAVADEYFQKEFGLPLALIWIDTMATAAGWKDEQDNAEASRALSVMRDLSTASGALVGGIDHFGKNVDAGSRGASAKEANSDFVLASIGDPRKTDGSVENTRLAIRKLRDGPQGITIPYEAEVVDMGKDQYQEPVTSCIINWDVKRPSRGKKYSDSEVLLGAVLNDVMADKKAMLDGVKAAKRDDVRDAFRKLYKGKDGKELKQSSKDERFYKAVKGHDSITTKTSDEGIEYLVWIESPF